MNENVDWYALTAILLFLKMLAVSIYQGFHRIRNLKFVTPEDAALVGRQAAAEELPQVQRASQVWRNDLENIPIFLALGVAYVWVEAPAAIAAWLFPTFIAARYLHTVFYLCSLQPWRTIAYAVGILSTLGMCIGIITAIF